MINTYCIDDGQLHMWHINLQTSAHEKLIHLLSQDEIKKANRFKFAIHRERYIVARGALRKILAMYLNILPQKIIFEYGHHGKPFINDVDIHFNLSHSHDMALLAIVRDGIVGVDIEKISDDYKQDVAKRFFSKNEIEELSSQSLHNQINAFYTIWTKKEAVIKALGEGLFVPLEDFTVSVLKEHEHVTLSYKNDKFHLYVKKYLIDQKYIAAIATTIKIDSITTYNFIQLS